MNESFNYNEFLASLTHEQLIKEQNQLEFIIDKVDCFSARDVVCLQRVYEEINRRGAEANGDKPKIRIYKIKLS